MTLEHSHDLTRALSTLVRAGHLESTGASRGTVYFFPGDRARVERNLGRGTFAFPETGQQLDLFGRVEQSGRSQQETDSSQQERRSSQQASRSSHQETGDSQQESLLAIAQPVRERPTAPRKLVESVILQLCTGRFLTLQQIALLLNRSPGTLHNHYLGRLVREKRLALKYRETPSHPNQAYTTPGSK